jgi:ketosteroid isomerase-like protein
MSLANLVQRGWDAVGSGDFDALVADYVEDMTFIMPGQTDVLVGRQAFRTALDGLGEILPPGFEITGLRLSHVDNR